MRKKEWDGKKKQLKHKSQIIQSEMGFLSNITTKKIKFNLKPNKKNKEKIEPETNTEIPTFVDLHLDITRKIDEVIKKHEQLTSNKGESTDKTTLTQMRKSLNRAPIGSLFNIETIQTNIEKKDASFELESGPFFNQNIQTNNLTSLSDQIIPFNEPLTIENIESVEKIDNNSNLQAGLSIKINKNPNQTKKQKTKDLTIAQTDLEKTKQELERKKHELEEIQRLAKEKEEELKRKEEEEKKLQKLNKKNQKQLEKEKRIKEKQLRLEQKKQEEEKLKLEKQLQIELEKQEKLKKIEEEKLRQEQELKKMLKEQEEKEKQLMRQQKIEQLEKKKEREKEENQTLLTEQEEIEEQMKEQEKNLDAKIEIKTQKTVKTNKQDLTDIEITDEEVGQIFRIVDNLLEKLPEEVIIGFIKSKDFEIYERVLSKYTKK